jgi:hypothetical protein
MQFKKLFDFTEYLEGNLKKLSEMPTISAERKKELLEKLEIVRNFNKNHDRVLKPNQNIHHV